MAGVGKLVNKVSIVTGGASGIGLAVCQRFIKEGAKVVVVDQNQDLLSSFCRTTNIPEERVLLKQGDVSQPGFADKVVKLSNEYFEVPATILVNSAGIGAVEAVTNMSDKSFNKVMEVNLNGTFQFTRAFLNQFDFKNKTDSHSPSVVNVSSMAGKLGMPMHCGYAASKGAVISFTKSVALEYGMYGIRCNAVLPGFTDTPLVKLLSPNYIQALIQQTPLKRLAQPEEIANACFFLASDESSYVNGACLEVSGGMGA